MPAQNQRKHSPRAQAKQIQKVSTPMRTEYAGPAFHHSPAPSSLPPPPFLALAKSKSQQKENNPSDLSTYTTAADSSPLSFLFSAKERESSLKEFRKEPPPTLGFHYTPMAKPATSAQQPRSVPSRAEEVEAEKGHAVQFTKQSSSSGDASSSADITKRPMTKKSPWAPIEKPPPVDVLVPNAKQETFPSVRNPREGPRTPRSRQVKNDRTPTSSSRAMSIINNKKNNDRQPEKRPSSESLRKRRTPKQFSDSRQTTTPAKITPKTILKRPVVEVSESPTTALTVKDTAKIVQARESSSSTFKPLQKKSPAARPSSGISHLRTQSSPLAVPRDHDSEVDLRRQAAHLMSILNVSSPPPREASPVRQTYPLNSTMHDSSAAESDLRRLLRL